ncbi:hypothetical protein OIE63_37200 [Streptomyces sp. NBC_01795]|uniref:hypothetical protein n=1 Tax=Streptomyces sp. NBC_01795 TaxID=2975943 RepID=UPI002DD8019F|nr:hypothetical protein [Streptomyces sp. NBC_01795]WSA96570.1 hypothetical protein OIE63_37200 [Streptomyces sp. NBC_01795]
MASDVLSPVRSKRPAHRVAVLVGGIAAHLDPTIARAAPRQLALDLDADVCTIQWPGTAYLPALGVVTPIVGRPRSRPSSFFRCRPKRSVGSAPA